MQEGRVGTSPMIIEPDIEGRLTIRVYLDGGGSSEIMYEHYSLECMKISGKGWSPPIPC